ncbi:MAG: hypothetical protein QOH99_336 [Frankiaceae bacterium]|jgi:hypothetical protein|nr:hypothetical protein [Frankiaceae bacterium]
MLVLTALLVPCGLLVLMMAMQQVQERLLPPVGPAQSLELPPGPAIVVIPAQAVYEPSESVVGSASLTSASPSR